jgi:hypothetical protein
MNATVKSSLTGMAIGAVIGMLPGIFSGVVGGFVDFLQASVHTNNASSLVVYLGLLIGGGAGAIVGAMASEAKEV